MGYGSYRASDWEKLKSSLNLHSKMKVEEVFLRNKIETAPARTPAPDLAQIQYVSHDKPVEKKKANPKFDPKFIQTRECFDSAEHPSTTPIVVGLDVTASMGYLAVEVGTRALNDLILKLYSTEAVQDPSLMCAAYGDYNDGAPLQVTQFESDIRIAEQLLDLYFENGGQCEAVPTALWYYLARHTEIDAYNKRNEKGFVFTIGDDAPVRAGFVDKMVSNAIGDDGTGITREGILKEVEEKFHVFHILIGGDQDPGFLYGRKMVIAKPEIVCIPEIIISAIQLVKGKSQEEILSQWDEMSRPVIAAAIRQLHLPDLGKPVVL